MATDITSYVNKIKNAIYGRDVRSAIVSAITKINDDNNKYDSIKAEVISARDTTVARSQQTIDAVNNAQSLIAEATSKNTTLTGTIKTATTKTTALNTAITKGETTIQNIDSAVKDALDAKTLGSLLYPVGSVYISVNATNPGTVFGGTWVQIKDQFLLAAGTKYAAGSTGGSADAIIPEHTHAITASSASAGAHTHTTSGTAASGGAHTHTVSGTAASAGAHTHTTSGTAASAGAHTHGMGNLYSSGSGSDSAYTMQASRKLTTRNTTSAGAHTHTTSGTAASAGAHTHTVSGTAASAGAHTHTTSGTAASAGAHTHTVTATAAKTGEAASGKNLPPYLAVYVWKRTA
uniref:phage baseplate protein n=1 Tax=Enterocloster clostridioformis TaxID=1531 RepID=UPI0025A58BFC|nr:hypothetical protein [Enterocloster clostridioformis]